jgi:hypothetical protein
MTATRTWKPGDLLYALDHESVLAVNSMTTMSVHRGSGLPRPAQ